MMIFGLLIAFGMILNMILDVLGIFEIFYGIVFYYLFLSLFIISFFPTIMFIKQTKLSIKLFGIFMVLIGVPSFIFLNKCLVYGFMRLYVDKGLMVTIITTLVFIIVGIILLKSKVFRYVLDNIKNEVNKNKEV